MMLVLFPASAWLITRPAPAFCVNAFPTQSKLPTSKGRNIQWVSNIKKKKSNLPKGSPAWYTIISPSTYLGRGRNKFSILVGKKKNSVMYQHVVQIVPGSLTALFLLKWKQVLLFIQNDLALPFACIVLLFHLLSSLAFSLPGIKIFFFPRVNNLK